MKKVSCWICGSGKVTEINIVIKEKINHYLCNECYFLFNKTNLYQKKKIKYYKDNSDNKLVDRYLSNEYFDTARFLNYINQILEKYCNLDQQLNHLDIGGGFGFFSKVLNKKFPKIKSFNLEPDKNAANLASKLNKKISTINLPFEKINQVKKIKFDLVTYWGGIYRTVEPNKVFNDLKKKCTQNCRYFFSFPFSFDDMRMQHLELKNSFDDYLLTGDGLQGFFGRNHMKIFLEKNNFNYKEIIFQNKPFKKKIPIFVFHLRKKYLIKKFDKKNLKSYFKKNISAYNYYFDKQIKNVLKSQKKINKIYILGDKLLGEYTFNSLKNLNKKVLFLNDNSTNLFKNSNLLNNILNLNNSNSNIFYVLENEKNGKIYKSLVNRFHLNNKNNIFIIKNNYLAKRDILKFEREIYLKKKIDLIKV